MSVLYTFFVFPKLCVHNSHNCGEAQTQTHTTRDHTIRLNLIIVNLSGDFCCFSSSLEYMNFRLKKNRGNIQAQ